MLFGSGTQSLHCGGKHFKDLLGDGAVEVLPIKMPNKLFPCCGANEIDERVPFDSLAVEVNRQVQIIVKAYESCYIKLLNQLFDVAAQGNVLNRPRDGRDHSRSGQGQLAARERVLVVPNFALGKGRGFLVRSFAFPC